MAVLIHPDPEILGQNAGSRAGFPRAHVRGLLSVCSVNQSLDCLELLVISLELTI